MKHRKTTLIFSALAIGLILSHNSEAQEILVSKSVLANGGAVVSDSSYRIIGTLGQPLVGLMKDGDQINGIGFWFIPVKHVATTVEDTPDNIPTEYRLEQNYPNPFNPATTIEFALPQKSHVTLKLFDVLGREVTTLVDEELKAGVHKTLFNATGLASGVYVYRIRTDTGEKSGRFVRSKKFILLK